MLKLIKPLVFFDLETTGTNTAADRIVSIALQKINPDGSRDEKSSYVNPGIPIPPAATKVHGITDGMVENAPTFKQISKGVLAWIAGCDIAGYNSDSFDVPMLMEEFERAAITWPAEGEEITFVDAYQMERHLNGHTLAATYERYTGKPLKDAHDAQVDTSATVEVLFAQLATLEKPKTPAELAALYSDPERVDIAGKIKLVDGVPHWTNFGKNKFKPVADDLQYCDWVLRADFPIETKRQIRKIIENEKAKK